LHLVIESCFLILALLFGPQMSVILQVLDLLPDSEKLVNAITLLKRNETPAMSVCSFSSSASIILTRLFLNPSKYQ